MTETTKSPVSTVDTGGFQISALMRFFERPGRFVDVIIPQFVQKEKPAGKRSSSGSLYTFSPKCVYSTSDGINSISHIQHFINAFQPIAYRRPAVVCLCCNVRQRKPLNVPQKSYLSVYPPKRCGFDGGGHLLSVKPLQRSGQHYTSRRHRQHRAKKAAAAVRRCAPLR